MIQKQCPPAKCKVLDEITGFARSRHPVKVYCYQWTTSNYKWRAMLPPGRSLAPACDCSLPLFPKAVLPVSKKRESIRPPSYSAIYESPFGMLSKFAPIRNTWISPPWPRNLFSMPSVSDGMLSKFVLLYHINTPVSRSILSSNFFIASS